MAAKTDFCRGRDPRPSASVYIYESLRIFAESMHAFTGVVEHHACAGVYVRQML